MRECGLCRLYLVQKSNSVLDFVQLFETEFEPQREEQKDDTDFDTDIIIHINSVLAVLSQLGVGPIDGYSISDQTHKWSDFLNDDKFQHTFSRLL